MEGVTEGDHSRLVGPRARQGDTTTVDPGYQLLFDANPLPMWVFDVETLRFLAVNEAAVAEYGYSREEFLHMTLLDIRPLEDSASLRRDVAAGPAPGSRTWRHRRKDGSLFLARIRASDVEFEGRKARLVAAQDVTDLERSTASAESAHRLLQAVIDQLPAVVFVLDADRRFTLVNAAWEEATGVRRRTALGRGSAELFPPAVAEAFARSQDAALRSDGPVTVEETVTGRRGTRTYQATLSRFGTSDAAPQGYLGVAVDVTERKATEERLLEYEKAVEGLDEMVFVVDRQYRYVLSNRSMLDYARLTPDELHGRTVEEVIGEEAFARARPHLARAFAGESVRYRTSFAFRDYGERDFAVCAIPIAGAGPRVERVACVVSDVTEFQRATRDATVSRDLANRLIESANVAFVQLGPDGRCLRINEAAERITGYVRAEVVGTDWFDRLVPRDRYPGIWRDFLAGVSRGDVPASYEGAILTRDGRERRILWSLSTIELEGNVHSYIAFGVDVTERRHAEEKHALLSRVVEQGAESVVITNPAGTIVYVNPAFERVSGFSREEVLGRNPRLLKSGHEDRGFYERMWGTLLAGEVWQGRLVNKRKDGTLYVEDAIISPVAGEDGALLGYVAAKRDVTQEENLQRQLAQAQRLEAIGRLAGGVAHDFNNLLGVITGYGEMVQRRLQEPALASKIDQVLEAAGRAAGLTRQLLAFSRQQVLQPRIIDVNEVVTDIEKMLVRLIGEDIALVTDLDPDLRAIKADPGQIEQIVMNLAVNARDAMPRGGTLTISTRNDGADVLLTVADTGVGMDAETQAHVFEPFFTTKEVGRGTGLGLATVYGIVTQSGGRIGVDSAPRAGTTFRIRLPAVAEEVPPRERVRHAAPRPKAPRTILLVEDDDALRSVLRETLEEGGYTVLVAASGQEAIDVAGRLEGPLDAIVTDVVMPGMNGREASERVRLARPDTKVLFASGYTDDAIARHGVLEPGTALINKPFPADELLRRLDELLEGTA